MTDETYVALETRNGIRYHKPTCKRIPSGQPPITECFDHVFRSMKPATCCKPSPAKAAEQRAAAGPRTNDTPPAAPSRADHSARTQRASAQRRALRKWEANGSKGKRPATPDYDAMKGEFDALNGNAASEAQEPATAPAPTETGKRRRITDPAEQRKLVKTLLDAGCKPSGLYKAFRSEGIMASGSWVEPIVAELTAKAS